MISVRFLQRGPLVAALVFSSVMLLAVTGCGGVKAHPVSGKVNFNGKPMTGTGSITFIPVVQKEGAVMAGGTVLDDGTYQLTTTKENDGALAGDYRVVITQVTSTEPKPVPDGQPAPKVTAALTPDQMIPTIYGDFATSPLTAKVNPGKNTIDFELPHK